MEKDRQRSRSPTCKFSVARDSMKKAMLAKNSRASSLEGSVNQDWRRSGSLAWTRSFEPFQQLEEVQEDPFSNDREPERRKLKIAKQERETGDTVNKEETSLKPFFGEKTPNPMVFKHSKTMKSLAGSFNPTTINRQANMSLRDEIVRQFQEYQQKQVTLNRSKQENTKEKQNMTHKPTRTQTLKQSLLNKAKQSQQLKNQQQDTRKTGTLMRKDTRATSINANNEMNVKSPDNIKRQLYFSKTMNMQKNHDQAGQFAGTSMLERKSKTGVKESRPRTMSEIQKEKVKFEQMSKAPAPAKHPLRQSFQQKNEDYTEKREKPTKKRDRWSSVDQVRNFAKDLEIKFRDGSQILNEGVKKNIDIRDIQEFGEKAPQWYNSTPRGDRNRLEFVEEPNTNNASSMVSERTKLKPGKKPIYLYNTLVPRFTAGQEEGIKIEVSYVNPTFKTNARISIPLTDSLTRTDLTRKIQESSSSGQLSHQQPLPRTTVNPKDGIPSVFVG